MRVVNLSHHPFVNRRPVVRLTVVLWLLGAVLLGVNVTLYRDYWLGTAENRERLATAEKAIEEQLEELETQDRSLSLTRLKKQNSKALFLNSLIARRTFPWSDLFDRLEEFTPGDVRLMSVVPLAMLTVERTRSDGTIENARPTSSDKSVRQPTDAVSLKLTGWAKSEEALATFLDTLYREPAFGPPLLQSESFENDSGETLVRFNLETSFLINSSESELQVAESPPPTDESSQGDEEVEVAMVEEADGLVEENDSGNEVRLPDASEPPRTPSQSPTAPPSKRLERTPEEEDAIQQEIDATRHEALQPASREPKRQTETNTPSTRDRQQHVEALRARAAARRNVARPPSNNPRRDNQGSKFPVPEPLRDEEDDPTDIKPPASSAPRVNRISWLLPFWGHGFSPAFRTSLVWKKEMST